jgi:hypothetical protein
MQKRFSCPPHRRLQKRLCREKKNAVATTPANVDPTMWSSLLHAGVVGSFMRLPYVRPQAEDLRAADARAAIYGARTA